MDKNFNYLKESERTLANSFYGDKIDAAYVMAKVNDAIIALQELDKIKKSSFYNKDNGIFTENPVVSEDDIVSVLSNDKQKAINLFHGIIGIATEAGELLEAITKSISNLEQLDLVNLKEESSDIFWYLAILARECDTTFEKIQNANIEKLKHLITSMK